QSAHRRGRISFGELAENSDWQQWRDEYEAKVKAEREEKDPVKKTDRKKDKTAMLVEWIKAFAWRTYVMKQKEDQSKDTGKKVEEQVVDHDEEEQVVYDDDIDTGNEQRALLELSDRQ